MVLLHRLRYLIYNKEISSGDYVLLVPSNNFKNFIKDISAQFRISFKAIFPYQAYYQMMLGKSGEAPDEDVSELVFDKQYLSRVYSKAFMQESYKALFDALLNQTDGLIELCENKLNELLEFEALIIDEEAETAKIRAVTEAKTASERVCNFISADITGFDDIPRFQKELNDAYDAAKTEYETVTDPNFRIVISPDDDRILNNSKLSQLRDRIAAEKEIIKKTSLFTAAAHKNKLAILQNEYDEAYKAVEKELAEEDKRAYAERAARSAYVFEGVTLGETKLILEELAALYSRAAEQISEAESKKNNLTEHLMEKFSREISDLNKMVGLSAEILQWRKYAVSKLEPAIGIFKKLMAAGEKLIESFCKHFTDSENKLVNDRYKSFSVRTEKQNEAYLNTRLLNICRKKIKDEFGVKLCKLYKHNWYLELYCQYLTRDTKWNRRQYIFMDEAQDLSVYELELINKINSYYEDIYSSSPYYVAPWTQYRYCTRSTYQEPSYGSWSSYSDTYQSSSSTKEVRTRTMYRYCDRTKVPTYHFQRWGSCGSWTTQPAASSATKQVESSTFYRYRDKVDKQTYIFYRWKDWSDWSEMPIEETDDNEVETQIMYRYKSK